MAIQISQQTRPKNQKRPDNQLTSIIILPYINIKTKAQRWKIDKGRARSHHFSYLLGDCCPMRHTLLWWPTQFLSIRSNLRGSNGLPIQPKYLLECSYSPLYIIRFISMKQSQKSNSLKVQQELRYSRASSYMFGEEQFIDLGASVPRHQEPNASIKLVVPEQEPSSNNNKSLTFEEKAQNLSFALKSEVEGEQVFKQFLVKFKQKEKILDQAVQSILEQQGQLSDAKMTICMFYLTYINFYYVSNHEIMLNDEFQDQQIGMLKTNFSFARHKKIIGINYQTLCNCNYGGKVRILQILEQRRKKRLKDLQNVLRLIGPCLYLAYESDVTANLRKVGQDMYSDGVEKSYSKIQLNQLLQCFYNFVLNNKISLRPRIEDYLKLFEPDSGQP